MHSLFQASLRVSGHDEVDDASCHITSGSVDSGYLAEKVDFLPYLPNKGSIASFRSSSNSPTSKASTKYWAKMQKSSKAPISSHHQYRTKISGSMGSVSSNSMVSPISSEGLFEEFGYYSNPISGRSLDQLYKTSTDNENDDHENIALRKEVDELRIKLQSSEEDKENIIADHERKVASIQNTAHEQSEAAKESQTKQAHLVERLQDKVAYYKDQCKIMEGRMLEVNGISNESQSQLSQTSKVLKGLEDKLRFTEQRHNEDIKQWQVKLEEQQEKNNTLVQVNASLRMQLDSATRKGDKLMSEIDILTENWDKLNEELIEKQNVTSSSTVELKIDNLCSGDKIRHMWAEIVTFRRQFNNMKGYTKKNLAELKSELALTGRELLSACESVQAKSNYILGDENDSKLIHVGSQSDLWMKLQETKSEKDALDRTIESLNSDKKLLQVELSKCQRQLKQQEETNVDLSTENNMLRSQSQPILKIKEARQVDAESDKIRLEKSISIIANQALMDMDEEQDFGIASCVNKHENHDSDHRLETYDLEMIRKKDVRSKDDSSDNIRGNRRARSMSPSASKLREDSVAVVKDVLSKRQIQVHGLKTKLALSTKRIDQISRSFANNQSHVTNLEEQLKAEKDIADSLKIKLDRELLEKASLKEKIDALMQEKSNILLLKNNLQIDFDLLVKTNATLKEEFLSEGAKAKKAYQESEESLKALDLLRSELDERLETIESYEGKISSLNDSLQMQKEYASKIDNELKLAQMKNESYNLQLQESQGTTTHEHRLEVQRLKEEKTLLLENYQSLQSSHSVLVSKAKEFEKEIESIRADELFTLRLRFEESQFHVDELSEQLSKVKTQYAVIVNDKSTLEGILNEERLMKEKLDIEYESVINKNYEKEKLVESMKFERSTLIDDLSKSNQECENIKEQMNIVCNEHSEMSVKIKELSTQVENLTQKLCQADSSYKQMLSNSYEENQETIQALQSDLVDLEKMTTSLQNEKEEIQKKLNMSNIQLKSTKLSLEEEILKNCSNQSKFQSEIEETKTKLSKTISQLKKELDDAEDYRTNELEENRRNLEKAHKGEIVRLSQEKAIHIENLRNQIENLSDELMKERKIHAEERLQEETSKQQAIAIAQEELNLVLAQNNELIGQINEATKENEALKSKYSSKGETDRNLVTSTKLENSRMKYQIEKLQDKFDMEKQALNQLYSAEKAQKEELEQQVNKLRQTIDEANEKLESLSEELQSSKLKVLQSESEKFSKTSKEIENLEKKYLESQNLVLRLEKSKQELIDHNHILELEKVETANRMQALTKSNDSIELEMRAKRNELNSVRENYNDIKERFENLENFASEQKNEISILKTDYQKLAEKHTRVVSKDGIQKALNNEKESNQVSKLNLRIQELESSKTALEKELLLKSAHLSEEGKKLSENILSKDQELGRAIEKINEFEQKIESMNGILGDSRDEIKRLSSKLRSEETRSQELRSKLKAHETELFNNDSDIQSIATILQQVRTAHSHSRSSTPTRVFGVVQSNLPSVPHRRSRLISGRTSGIVSDNSFRQISDPTQLSNNDVILKVKSHARELVNKMALSEKENEDLRQNIAELKIRNDDLLSNTLTLEEQVSRAKFKIKGSEEQQKRLESKISSGDISLATQDEALKRYEQESRQLLRKLSNTTRQLEDSEHNRISLENEVKVARESENKLETELREMKHLYQNCQLENSKHEILRKGFETEQKRLKEIVEDKERQLKDVRSKCDDLSRDVTSLENKCSSLNRTVDNLHAQLDELNTLDTDKVNETNDFKNIIEQKMLNEENIHRLERSLQVSQSEKNLFEKKLNALKNNFDNLSASKNNAEKTIHDLKDELQRSESKLNATNIELYNTKLTLESNGQDDVIRNELIRVRKEKETLYKQLQNANSKLAIAEADKLEYERRFMKQKSKISSTAQDMIKQVDHVRTQIPLVAAGVFDQHSGSQAGTHLTHHHILKIRIAEQETERQRKKVKALEEQLASLEKLQIERINALLFERQKEKEKDLKRHQHEVLRCQETLNARERIYKERINGLEKQIETLRDQLDKELKRRKNFISNTTGINNDITHLRSNLDESLKNIAANSYKYRTTTDLGKTLNRESSKLQELGQKFEQSSSASKVRNTHVQSNLPFSKAKRTLSFENIIT